MNTIPTLTRRQFIRSATLMTSGVALAAWPGVAAVPSGSVPASRLARLAAGDNICRWVRFPMNESADRFNNSQDQTFGRKGHGAARPRQPGPDSDRKIPTSGPAFSCRPHVLVRFLGRDGGSGCLDRSYRSSLGTGITRRWRRTPVGRISPSRMAARVTCATARCSRRRISGRWRTFIATQCLDR